MLWRTDTRAPLCARCLCVLSLFFGTGSVAQSTQSVQVPLAPWSLPSLRGESPATTPHVLSSHPLSHPGRLRDFTAPRATLSSETVRPFLCWPTTCHGTRGRQRGGTAPEWCSHSTCRLFSGRVYHPLCHATSSLWTTSPVSVSSVHHHRALAGAASLSGSAGPGVPIQNPRAPGDELDAPSTGEHLVILVPSSSPSVSHLLLWRKNVQKWCQDSHKTGPVNERERNNGLPCIWQVKPEVLHREHSLEADTPQLLEVHERHAELEIVPVAGLQHGAPNEIGGKPPPRVSGFNNDVSSPQHAHVLACRGLK